MKNNYKKWSLIAVFWLVLWEVLSLVVGNKLLLPGPVDALQALMSLMTDGSFYMDALATIGRCLLAMLLALVAGLLLSICAYRRKWVRDVLSFPVSLFKTIPIMAVAIYMILLMSADSVPVLVCWIMCFPIVYTNLLAGLDHMDSQLLEMTKVYSIEGRSLVRWIYAPSLYPYFSSAMSLMAGMSWKAIVTAEVLSIPEFSLGYELMNAKYYLNTDQLFAYIVAIIAISWAFEKLIKLVLTSLKPHEYQYSKVLKSSGKTAEIGALEHTVGTLEHPTGALEHAEVGLNDVSKRYGDKMILDGFNLTLEPGKVTALMAPSGAGKTTAARILSGLETADAGEVMAPSRISYLFQEDRLIPWLNVYDNLAIVLDNQLDDVAVTDSHDPIMSILKTVELDDEAWKLPGELSGGMSYRVAMARAFLYNAHVLIADEPFRGLDAATKQKAIDKLWHPGVAGKTVMLITHSAEDAELAEKIIRM